MIFFLGLKLGFLGHKSKNFLGFFAIFRGKFVIFFSPTDFFFSGANLLNFSRVQFFFLGQFSRFFLGHLQIFLGKILKIFSGELFFSREKKNTGGGGDEVKVDHLCILTFKPR